MSNWKIVAPYGAENNVRNPSAEKYEVLGPELVQNGGFETAGGGGADVFANWVELTAGGSTVNDELVFVYAGSHACRLDIDAPANLAQITQTFTVEPGKMYVLEFFFASTNECTGTFMVEDDTNSVMLYLDRYIAYSATYRRHRVAFVAPNTCTSIMVYFRRTIGVGSCSLYFDNVSVKEVNAGYILGSAFGLSIGGTYGRSYYKVKYGSYSHALSASQDNDGITLALRELDNTDYYVTARVLATGEESVDETGANFWPEYSGLAMASDYAALRVEGVDLTEYIGGFIVLRDSSDNRLCGYISAPDSAESLGAELLLNTGFEIAGGGGADVFANWTEVAVGGGAVVDDMVDVHSGAHACRLDGVVAGSAHVSQLLTTTYPDRLYKLSFWTHGDGTNSLRVYLNATSHSGSWAFYNFYTGITGATYQQYTMYFTSPLTCITLGVQFAAPNVAGSQVWVDDVSIKVVDTLGTDAVEIADAPTSAYRQWMLEESGFERNDTSGYTFEVYEKGTSLPNWDWSLDDSTYTSPVKIKDIDEDWELYGLEIPAAQANGSTALWIRQNGAGFSSVLLDAIQVEEAIDTYDYSTYIDGDQPGCEFLGAAHDSASSRSAVSRAGGVLRDFSTYYSFDVGGMVETGNTPVEVNIDEYSTANGGNLDNIRTATRSFAYIGVIRGSGWEDLHAKRQVLIEALAYDAYPKVDDKYQPIVLQYEGAAVIKQIQAHYVDGLRGKFSSSEPCVWERLALQFVSNDPFWYGLGNDSALLDLNDEPTIRYLTGRIRGAGQWDDLGLTANPTANGTIHAVCVASDHSVYFGGDFTGLDGVAGRDYIARYIPSTETWETVGAASQLNGIVYCIIEAPNGDIYVGGAFTDGAGDKDYISIWDGDDWNALGQPVQGAAAITSVRDIQFDNNTDVIIVGEFSNWANIANADGIVRWDSSASSYTAVGAPAPGGAAIVYSVAIDTNNDYYFGGDFLNLGGVAAADYLGMWDGSAYSDVGGVTPNGAVYDLIFYNNELHLAGNFTDLAGLTGADYIARFNGYEFEALQTGLQNYGVEMRVSPDNLLYVVGAFTSVSGIANVESIVAWNGTSWIVPDIDFGVVWRAIDFDTASPITSKNYNIYAGLSATSSGVNIGGSTTVSNTGTAVAYPTYSIEYLDGSYGLYSKITMRSETTGSRIFGTYTLSVGEKIEFANELTGIVQISSFYDIPDILLPGSDDNLLLLPGDNVITCYIVPLIGFDTRGFVVWKNTYKSLD